MTDKELIASLSQNGAARNAAQCFIDAYFNNDNRRPIITIPAHESNDDLVLMRVISDAADRLEALTAENKRLREALEDMATLIASRGNAESG